MGAWGYGSMGAWELGELLGCSYEIGISKMPVIS